VRSFVFAAALLLISVPGSAQDPTPCRILCTPEFKIEPTITVSNVFGSPRMLDDDGHVIREGRSSEIEVIFSFGIPTGASWLEFTVEAIVLPFERDGTPELEFETNLIWLPAKRTGGWVSSHFDIVDKFSAAERPTDRRAYTHKLNFEVDTSVSIFNRLREGRWLRGVELEGSLDYVATGLARAGDRVAGGRLLDRASAWSFSLVAVLPIAPF
jgi:hypothetical protein